MTCLDPCPLGKWIEKLLAPEENLLVPDNRTGKKEAKISIKAGFFSFGWLVILLLLLLFVLFCLN